MKNVVLAVLVLAAMIMLAVGLVGCDGERDPLNQNLHINGTWKGDFNQDHPSEEHYPMTLTLDKDNDGGITGTAKWDKYPGKEFDIDGKIRYGRIEATLKCKDSSIDDEFGFSGSIDSHESSGNWESDPHEYSHKYYGKFSLKKQ